MLKKILSLCALVGALTVASVAANAYSLQYTSSSFGLGVTSYYGASGTVSGFTGASNYTFVGGAGTPPGIPTTFQGYCVQIENYYVNPQDVLIKNASDLTRNGISPNSGLKAAWLFNKYKTTVDTNVKGAALQVAIWEALYDTSYNLSSGYYRTDAGAATVIAQANIYLNDLAANYSIGTVGSATWFDAPDTTPGQFQDIIGPGGPAAVPEPGAMGLLASGSLSALYAFRRRFRKSK